VGHSECQLSTVGQSEHLLSDSGTTQMFEAQTVVPTGKFGPCDRSDSVTDTYEQSCVYY
jgi:hypothetical protein